MIIASFQNKRVDKRIRKLSAFGLRKNARGLSEEIWSSKSGFFSPNGLKTWLSALVLAFGQFGLSGGRASLQL